jgi:hypothetical protein
MENITRYCRRELDEDGLVLFECTISKSYESLGFDIGGSLETYKIVPARDEEDARRIMLQRMAWSKIPGELVNVERIGRH